MRRIQLSYLAKIVEKTYDQFMSLGLRKTGRIFRSCARETYVTRDT